MPINVAQLNILVTADTATANANLNQLNDTLRQSFNSLNSGAGAATNFGSIGARSIATFNQAVSASGQSFGPFNQGLSLAGTLIAQMPSRLDAAKVGVLALAAAMSGLAVVVANLNAKQVQEQANLETALADSGKNWDDYADTIQTAIDKGAGWGYTQAQVEHSLATMAPFIKDQNQLLAAFNVVADAAARRHMDLSAATDLLTRGFGGTSRGLRIFTADLDLVANAEKTVTTLTQQLADAMASLEDAKTRAAQVQAGPSNAAEQAAVQAERMQQAVLQIGRAQQDLDDLMAKIAARDAGPQIDHVAAATAHLAEAQARLNDINAQQHTAAQGGTAEELNKLAEASQKVLDAQMRMANAQGGDIVTAQNALRGAVEEQRKALDAQYEKQQQIITGSAQDISAKEAVRKAVEDLAIAQHDQDAAAHGQSQQQIQDAEDIRHAQERITDAIAAVARQRLEDAASAHTNDAAIINSLDTVGDAQRKVNELQQKLTEAQGAAAHNVEEVLSKVGPVVSGSADAMANTWKGHLDRMIADTENWLADLGNTFGPAAALLIPLISNLLLIRTLQSGGAVAGAGELAAGGGGMAEGLAGIVAAIPGILEVAAVLAALALVAYLVYRNFDTIKRVAGEAWDWIRDKTAETWHAVFEWVVDQLHNIINVIKNLPERLGDAFVLLRDWGYNMITGFFDGALSFWTDRMWPWIQNLPGYIQSALSGLYDILFNVGEDILNGLWDGITSVWNGIMSGGGALVDFFGSLLKDIKKFWNSSSPSKVMHDVGRDVMLGFHEGLLEGSARPEQTMRDAMARIARAQAASLTIGGQSAVGGLAGSFIPQGNGAALTIHNTRVDLVVQGSVTSENDLAQTVKDKLIETGHGQGGDLLGGYA